jgi:hypothetical protein
MVPHDTHAPAPDRQNASLPYAVSSIPPALFAFVATMKHVKRKPSTLVCVSPMCSSKPPLSAAQRRLKCTP